MTTTLDCTELVQKKIKELPPLPLAVQKLVAIMEDQSSSAEDVTEILSSDQALAGKVLKLSNSSFYGLSGEVATISRAVVILGFSAVRNLATGLGVIKLLGKPSTDGIQRDFWSHAVTAAAAAYVVARHTDYPDPEEAFIAGLLHDLGQLLLVLAVPDQFKEVVALGCDRMTENEQKLIGVTHNKAGQQLLKHWKLPKNLCDAVRFHHTPKVFTGQEDPLVSIVALADALSCAHGIRYEGALDEADFRKLIKNTGLQIADVGEMLEEMNVRVDATARLLNLDEEFLGRPGPRGAARKIVLLSTDSLKTTWAQQLLGHYGDTIVPMKQFFAEAAQGSDVDVVLLDPTGVKKEQLAKIKPVLDLVPGRVALFGPDPQRLVASVLGIEPPVVPLAFSRTDLDLDR